MKLSEKDALTTKLSMACHLADTLELLAEPKSL